jgi:hypothetical protein
MTFGISNVTAGHFFGSTSVRHGRPISVRSTGSRRLGRASAHAAGDGPVLAGYDMAITESWSCGYAVVL